MAFTFTELSTPTRIEVRDDREEWVATFTMGCYTVTLAGPARTLSETFRRDGAVRKVSVTHSTWVRCAPGPVDRTVDLRWLERARAANTEGTADALAIAMQYVRGASPIMQGDLQIAGDASYGPLGPDGQREEGADFNDYLGLRWLYPADPPDRPESRQHRCLDCSGYVRMIWGYRHHLPGAGYLDTVSLSIRPHEERLLPRRAFEQYADAPGLILVPNTGAQVTDFSALGIGDLVFFDASDDDGAALDHVGMYVGTDTSGGHRFISSRKTANGPTLADAGGASLLDGAGYYARAFRAVRRL